MIPKSRRAWLVAVALAFASPAAHAGEAAREARAEPLQLAVAANFRAVFPIAARGYGGEVVPSYGSSGLLYAQIVQGRPFDVFLSADAARPQALADAGRASAPVVYARGRLALVVTAGLVNAGAPAPGWLTRKKRVAIANPDAAPYGRAATQTLAALGAAPRRVVAMNVAQAFHFAASGAADGAFVALAQALAERVPAERTWIVPDELHQPIEQAAVAIRGGNEPAAAAFLEHLASAETQARLRAAGYR